MKTISLLLEPANGTEGTIGGHFTIYSFISDIRNRFSDIGEIYTIITTVKVLKACGHDLSPNLLKEGSNELLETLSIILLPSFVGKCMERSIRIPLLQYFIEIILLTCHQSGFVSNDCMANQLIYMYTTFCSAANDRKEVRVVFAILENHLIS